MARAHRGHEITGFLADLCAEVSEWHARELPNTARMVRVAKVGEEAGELIGAVIKAEQNIKRTPEEWITQACDELADVIISACGAAEAIGIIDLQMVVAMRWREVKARRFATIATTVYVAD
jgi:hypothetical protein